MTTPESIEPQYTLLTAVSRLDELRMREAMGGATDTPTGPNCSNSSP